MHRSLWYISGWVGWLGDGCGGDVAHVGHSDSRRGGIRHATRPPTEPRGGREMAMGDPVLFPEVTVEIRRSVTGVACTHYTERKTVPVSERMSFITCSPGIAGPND
jgi:hypothetical protein